MTGPIEVDVLDEPEDELLILLTKGKRIGDVDKLLLDELVIAMESSVPGGGEGFWVFSNNFASLHSLWL